MSTTTKKKESPSSRPGIDWDDILRFKIRQAYAPDLARGVPNVIASPQIRRNRERATHFALHGYWPLEERKSWWRRFAFG